MSKKVMFIIGSISFLFWGCVLFPKTNNLTRDFFRNTTTDEEKIRKFHNYSLDEQYEIIVFESEVVHPPSHEWISEFAKQGPIIIPFIKTKLKTTKNEHRSYLIFSILRSLYGLQLYDFSKDQELKILMEQRLNSMHGLFKDLAHNKMAMIYGQKQEDANCNTR